MVKIPDRNTPSRPYQFTVKVGVDGKKAYINISVGLHEIVPTPTQEELNEIFLDILAMGCTNPNYIHPGDDPSISVGERVAEVCGYLQGKLEPAGDIPLKRRYE